MNWMRELICCLKESGGFLKLIKLVHGPSLHIAAWTGKGVGEGEQFQQELLRIP